MASARDFVIRSLPFLFRCGADVLTRFVVHELAVVFWFFRHFHIPLPESPGLLFRWFQSLRRPNENKYTQTFGTCKMSVHTF